MDYVHSLGKASNGAKVFSMVDSVGGFSTITVTLVAAAANGVDQESLESIRYNAPLTFTSQNRAVTSDDYRSIILREFSNIAAISTWGGEDEDLPDYGRIYICIRPQTAGTLTAAEKAQILDTILKGKNVVSITPIIRDPNYSYLELDVSFKYNPNLTDRSAVDLKSVVSDTIDDYDLNDLNKFDGVFRHSQLLKAVDSADPAILSSSVRPFLFQNIIPDTTKTNDFTLTFPGAFYVPNGADESVITSTAWNVTGNDPQYFADKAIAGSTNRQLYAYKINNNVKVVTIDNAGTVTPTTGTIKLENFQPTDATAIRITVIPNSLDIAPKRDQLLSIDSSRTTMTASEDTIAVSGSSGAVDYTTTTRFRA